MLECCLIATSLPLFLLRHFLPKKHKSLLTISIHTLLLLFSRIHFVKFTIVNISGSFQFLLHHQVPMFSMHFFSFSFRFISCLMLYFHGWLDFSISCHRKEKNKFRSPPAQLSSQPNELTMTTASWLRHTENVRPPVRPCSCTSSSSSSSRNEPRASKKTREYNSAALALTRSLL